ncbi:MAG: caspase family protein [Bacteroidia bacterium]
MKTILYLIACCTILLPGSYTQAQTCSPQYGYGPEGIQAIADVVDWVDRAFSGKRKSVTSPNYDRANEDFLKGFFEEARRGYTLSLSDFSGNRDMLARVRYQRGVCNYILSDFEDAKTDFNAAIRFRPDVPDAYYFRGKVYQVAMEQPYLARRDFQRVTNMSKAATIQKAYSAYFLGNARAANDMMNEVINKSRGDRKSHANALYNMAGLKALMGRTQDACRFLNDALVSGFSEKAWMMLDLNLEPIRGSECYNIILRNNDVAPGNPRYILENENVNSGSGSPSAPAYLSIEGLEFIDPSGNNRIEPGEKTYIEFDLKNTGQGMASNMELVMHEETGLSDLGYSQSKTIGNLTSGEEKRVQVEVIGGRNLQEGQATFKIMVRERNGFDSNPSFITLSTGEAYKPNLTITDPHFTSAGGGKARPGVPMILKLAVQNTGQGTARGVSANVDLPSNVFTAGDKMIVIGDLAPGDFKILDIEFFTNRRYAEATVPVTIVINESKGNNLSQETFTVTMNQDLEVDARVVISPNDAPPAPVDINTVQLRSDADRDLPRTGMNNPDAIAVIIGNRDYQNQDVPSVDFALNDALSMKRYLVNVLGYDENNVIMLNNASQADFNGMFGTKESHKARLFNLVKKNQSDVFVYYSGHGAPDLESNEGYFVPVDCDPTLVRFNGYAIKTLYDNLAKIPYRKLSVVIDACFSGSSDKGTLMPFTSLARIRTSSNLLSDPNATVLTSATNDQVATWYPEQYHGLFTYYFLKGLQGEANQDRDNRLTLLELKTYLNEQVPYMARRLRNRTQTPEIYGQEGTTIIAY